MTKSLLGTLLGLMVLVGQGCGLESAEPAEEERVSSADLKAKHLVLFGGNDAHGHALSAAWAFGGAAWTQHNVAGPSPRWGSVAGALGGDVVLFGGAGPANAEADTNTARGDTWVWNGSKWHEVNVTGPSA